jgi:hypothetical protein
LKKRREFILFVSNLFRLLFVLSYASLHILPTFLQPPPTATVIPVSDYFSPHSVPSSALKMEKFFSEMSVLHGVISQLTVIFRDVNIRRNSLQIMHTSEPLVKLQGGLPSVAYMYKLRVASNFSCP